MATKPSEPAGQRAPGVEAEIAVSGGSWSNRSVPPDAHLASAFERLVEEVRVLEALVAGSRPTVELAGEIAERLAQASQLLEGYQVDERHRLSGKLSAMPGRGQALVPVVHFDEVANGRVLSRVRFSAFYLGGNGAAHGGALPLVFDELLGRLAGGEVRAPSRTAYLHVNYRRITPLERDLTLRGSIDRIEGRKIFTVGSLHDGEDLLCDAEALFVVLRPGQP